MAVAVRSFTSTAYASRTNTTLTAPSGLADNDILLAGIFVGASGTAPSVATPSGFTALTGSPTSVTDDGGFNGKLNVFWKRAASESGSYTFSHSAASSQGLLLAISGAVTSGSPIDASSNNTGVGKTSTATGVTTTVTNDLLVYIAHDWEGAGALSPPSGFTEIFDNLIYAASQIQSSSGASGNKTQTNANTASSPWAAWLVAVKPAAGAGSQTLTPSKYTNTNTFYAPTVARGARTLSPSLFSNSNTFYTPLVKSRYTLTPAKSSDADIFYSATVSRGPRTLTTSLFSDGDTFYSPTVGRGSVSLHPSLFTDGDTFHSPTVTQGPITLRPGLFVDTDAFYAPTVGRGAVTLSPSSYVDQDTFYSATVTTIYRLSPAKSTDGDTFYAPVVGRGSVTLFPPFLNDADSFYPQTVEGGSPAAQSLLPELLVDVNTFYAPRVEGGAREQAIDQHDGLGPRRVEYIQRAPRKKRLDEEIHDAVERALQRIDNRAHLTAKEAVQVERVVESIAEQATVADLPDMSGLVAALDDVGKALSKLERKRNLERLRKYEEDLEDEHAAMLLLS